jgi:hypothetical protein
MPRSRVLVAVLPLLLAGCATLSANPRPAAEQLQLDRLYFGRAIADTGMVSDSAWALFVREIVTPRFPAGITTWRSEGQWRSASGAIVREPSVVLEIAHPATVVDDTAVEDIVREYKRRFRQEAVLRLTSEVRARF